ncbi:hypothetical protein ASG40_17005 [Methylobacterium sp. Leaf399]|uniref:hypothetical protein n=1 Tax=Methylobacterium sp. Leaf399 TaxID=1736364 RepID=UPI0007004FC0|nr:hypothetical protein [Methylobacterium sp. Leaf399]KQT17720.1 hypothetical protein ASG40_17005 [Methylobacterium sp. Leaf399]
MIVARTPQPTQGVRGVNVVLYSGGELHIDDIETAAQGQAILDEIDGAISTIEDQFAHGVTSEKDPSWRARAEIALKRKRRQRPRLQQRIGELRRAERQVLPPSGKHLADYERREARRRAFIDAAKQMLDAEMVTEIWARAAEQAPDAFAELEASHD